MLLALAAFVRLWIISHKPKEPEPGQPPAASAPGMQVDVESPSSPSKAPSPGTSPACMTLERTLEGVVRNPEDGAALAEARKTLDACVQPPARACELGTALDARAPLTPQASPARGLLQTLCQKCPPQANTCAALVVRALQGGQPGRKLEPAEVRWNLENAGSGGAAAACAAMAAVVLVPAATPGGKVAPEHPALVTELAPLCAKSGNLPPFLVNAVVVQRGTSAGNLSALATPAASAQAEGTPVAPKEITGAEAGSHAFDGKEKSGVDLGNGVTPRWEADGALRAQFASPLKALTAVRVRAKGPGTVRAIVRTPQGLGLQDPERGTSFVNPTVCHFKGTGQWESCTAQVPLLSVEAISVFPEQPMISLYELEARGTP